MQREQKSKDIALNYSIDKATYLQLKRIAALFMRGEKQGHTLSPTALVNEAYLRLHTAGEKGSISHRSFLSSAARAMRQILVDHARSKKAEKRGGGISAITLDEGIMGAATTDIDIDIDIDILSLNSALDVNEHANLTHFGI